MNPSKRGQGGGQGVDNPYSSRGWTQGWTGVDTHHRNPCHHWLLGVDTPQTTPGHPPIHQGVDKQGVYTYPCLSTQARADTPTTGYGLNVFNGLIRAPADPVEVVEVVDPQ